MEDDRRSRLGVCEADFKAGCAGVRSKRSGHHIDLEVPQHLDKGAESRGDAPVDVNDYSINQLALGESCSLPA